MCAWGIWASSASLACVSFRSRRSRRSAVTTMLEDYNRDCMLSSVFLASAPVVAFISGFDGCSPENLRETCGNPGVPSKPPEPKHTLGWVLRSMREAKGWTRAQLAPRAGVTMPVIFDAEKDRRTNITRPVYEDICKALGDTLDNALTRVDPDVPLPPSILGIRKPVRRKPVSGLVSETRHTLGRERHTSVAEHEGLPVGSGTAPSHPKGGFMHRHADPELLAALVDFWDQSPYEDRQAMLTHARELKTAREGTRRNAGKG